jgi:4-hydroxy 2-oxovalerate aldolase
MTDNLTILDCTLRDGGYYNSWNFNQKLVERYLRAADRSGIDVVEIGFRFFAKDEFLGPYAYSTDNFIRTLELPKRAAIAVMSNAGDLINFPDGPQAAVDFLYNREKDSPVSIVRLATHLHEVTDLRPVIERLKELGYTVGLNLMQVSRALDVILSSLAAEIHEWGLVDVLYFADSLGNMDEHSIRNCIDSLAKNWSGPIGIHAHNNTERALTNTLAAYDQKATWLDATMLGMGRGAGNARMEFLLCEMGRGESKQYDADAIASVVLDDFQGLQNEYGWGTNLLYYMSAQDDIHPTYVQTMYNDMGYDLPDVMNAMARLKTMKGHSYSRDGMLQAIKGSDSDGEGSWSAKDWLSGKDVLLLGSGPSVLEHRDAIIEFTKSRNLAVLSLNLHSEIPEELIAAYIVCHPARILMDYESYVGLKRPLIIPFAYVPAFIQQEISNVDCRDYGMRTEEHSFEIRDNGCTIPSSLTAAYGLALSSAANANRIFLAGFDGFDLHDYRQYEMVDVFEHYMTTAKSRSICSITPTTFPISQSSVYAPIR